LFGRSSDAIQHARHQVFSCAENQPAIFGRKGRNARRLLILADKEITSRFGALLELASRLPQRSAFYRPLIKARDVNKFKIADVVKSKATLLAGNFIE